MPKIYKKIKTKGLPSWSRNVPLHLNLNVRKFTCNGYNACTDGGLNEGGKEA